MPVSTPIPPDASLKVQLIKLGQHRLGFSILEQRGISPGFILEQGSSSHRTISPFYVACQSQMDLSVRGVYLQGLNGPQRKYVSFPYPSVEDRDEAFDAFLSLLTEVNQGVDPRVELTQLPSTQIRDTPGTERSNTPTPIP